MSAHRPIAHRVFTVLFAALLIGSLVAPIGAAEPAAAQSRDGDLVDGSFEGTCDTNLKYILVVSCPHAEWAVDQPEHDGSAASTQMDFHVIATSEYESSEALTTVHRNYGQDTETIASLEARHAIATAYQQGNTTTEANSMARQAIRDYYAQRQVNLLEAQSKQNAQLEYIQNISRSNDDLHSKFIYPNIRIDDEYNEYYRGPTYVKAELANQSYNLVNGTAYDWQALNIKTGFTYQDGSSTTEYDRTLDHNTFVNTSVAESDRPTAPYRYKIIDDPANGNNFEAWWNGRLLVRAAYEGTNEPVEDGQPAQQVYDYKRFHDMMAEYDDQANTLVNNYDNSLAEDLYAAMDAGRLSPSELRGAEGQIRFMSGDDDGNVTEGRFRMALLSTLEVQNPDLTNASTMTVTYDGFTNAEYTSTTNDSVSRTLNYTNPVNQTYQGLLFAGDTPTDGFQTGNTYNTTDLNGSVIFHTENGETVRFAKGEFTVDKMTDTEGNEVDSTNWERPKYDSYNADKFIEYLNETKQQRQVIIKKYEDGGEEGSQIGLPSIPGLPGAGGAFIGLVIIGGAVVVVVGFVMRD